MDQRIRDAYETVRQHYSFFSGADRSDDRELSFEDFAQVLPQRVRDNHRKEEIKMWFTAADMNHDGIVSRAEFVQWSLGSNAKKFGDGALAIFKAYDNSDDGCLDELEFTKAARDLGFGEEAGDLFKLISHDGALHYAGLLNEIINNRRRQYPLNECLIVMMMWSMTKDSIESKPPRIGQLDLAADTWSFGGIDPQSARAQLAQLLDDNDVGLVDVFEHFDKNNDNYLSCDEFVDGLENLGFSGPREVLLTTFHQLDEDDSNNLAFDEFSSWIRGSALSGRARRRALKHVSLSRRVSGYDEPWDEDRLREELRGALEEAGARPSDLLETWDVNGDGTIRKKEWLQNWKKLMGIKNELWYDKVRGAVEDVFELINTGDDEEERFEKNNTLSIREIDVWLNPRKRSASAKRCVPARSSWTVPSPQARLVSPQADFRSPSTSSVAASANVSPPRPHSSLRRNGHGPTPRAALWRPNGHRPAWPLDYGLQRDKARISAQRPTPAYRPAPPSPSAHGASSPSDDKALGSPRTKRVCELHDLSRVAAEAARSPYPGVPPEVLYISRKLNWPPKGIRVLRPERAHAATNVAFVNFGVAEVVGRLAVQGGPPGAQPGSSRHLV